jgi:hypothetical protein
MKFSTVVGEAFVRSSNLRLRNFFDPFWNNEGKFSHFSKDMPSKFSIADTYHIQQSTNNYQYE